MPNTDTDRAAELAIPYLRARRAELDEMGTDVFSQPLAEVVRAYREGYRRGREDGKREADEVTAAAG